MALNNTFYNDIFIEEEKWIEMINRNLFNNVYCKLTLKPFYLDKKKKLEEEYRASNNVIIEQIIPIIDDILLKLDYIDNQYNNSETINFNKLISMFLINKMNNSYQNADYKQNSCDIKIDELKLRKQVIESLIGNLSRDKKEEYDYVYEDFPEEVNKTK